MVGWHQRLDGHEYEQAPGAGDGQGSQACCNARGHSWTRLSDSTENFPGGPVVKIPHFHCRGAGFPLPSLFHNLGIHKNRQFVLIVSLTVALPHRFPLCYLSVIQPAVNMFLLIVKNESR